MSVLIKGMDMPKKCVDCDLFSGEGYLCPLTNPKGWTAEVMSKRVAKCPLVEVPTPHGRLIDADELFDPMEEALYAGIGCDPTSIANRIILEAPTIIEEEVSE